ncbi:hypothetical protein V5J35_001187 [Endozoicomonas sp. NE40]|uniref:Uncharacterized protein n=1 Tax=Endozoicomonas lisbonensis TaxID=3120522 RepID=A0ABV2SE03_9GAMM
MGIRLRTFFWRSRFGNARKKNACFMQAFFLRQQNRLLKNATHVEKSGFTLNNMSVKAIGR